MRLRTRLRIKFVLSSYILSSYQKAHANFWQLRLVKVTIMHQASNPTLLID